MLTFPLIESRTLYKCEDLTPFVSKGNEYSVDFGNIKLIEKKSYGSEVVLKTGRELRLSNSNDVNNENRGVIVKNKSRRVVIPWSEFKEVVLKEYPEEYHKYSDYNTPKKLSGNIFSKKDDINYDGEFVFGLDEEYDFEIFHGKDDNGLEYLIPFKNIKRIERINSNTCMMDLKNGSDIRLGNSQDSSDDNNGILLKNKEIKGSRYIAWENINYIELD